MPVDGKADSTDGASAVNGTQITTPQGESYRGELIHIYDNRDSVLPCPGACDKLIYGLFDPSQFSPDEQADHSMQFVCVDPEVPGYLIEPIALAPGTETFAGFRARLGLSFARLPLDGVWYVYQGNDGYHLLENGAGNFAWDFIMLENGATGMDPDAEAHCRAPYTACSLDTSVCTGGASNHDYYTWYRCISSPNAGKLVVATDVNEDLCPGPESNVPNYAYVQLTGGYRILLSHLAQGSLRTSVGASLVPGDSIGVVGDSGYTLAPHLHTSLYWHGKDTLENCQGGWSIPGTFDGLYQKPASDRGDASWQADFVPTAGTFVSNTAFADSQNPFVAGCPAD